jgi:hypothetical protein
MTDKATPRPWKAHGPLVYMGREGGFDLRHCPEPEANAALIVEAVNSYDAHKAMIAELVEALELVVDDEATFPVIYRAARAALAKAKAVTG